MKLPASANISCFQVNMKDNNNDSVNNKEHWRSWGYPIAIYYAILGSDKKGHPSVQKRNRKVSSNFNIR